MRIGFITQWYPPEQGAGLSASIAEGLANLGHTVDVLTGYPNYPTGKVYAGYSVRAYQRELASPSVTVHRAPLYPSHSRSAFGRVLNYVTFAVGAAAVAHSIIPRPDAWLVYSSPATAAVPVLIPGPKAAPFALLVQDLWPDSVTQSGFIVPSRATHMAEGLLHRFCQFTYRRARRIGVISPSMREVFISRGVPPNKLCYTPNWAVGASRAELPVGAAPTNRELLGLPAEGVLFLYAGNIGALQDLEQLVQNFPTSDSAQLVLMGDGVCRERIRHLAAHRKNIHMKDPVPASQVKPYLEQSDALVVSLADTPLLRATMPSKMQASLAAGRPILVHGSGDVANVVVSAGSGAAAQPGDVAALHQAVAQIMELSPAERVAMGQRARALYREEFDYDLGIRRISEMLHEVTESGRSNHRDASFKSR